MFTAIGVDRSLQEEGILSATRLEATAPALNSSPLSAPERSCQRLALLPYAFSPGLCEHASHPTAAFGFAHSPCLPIQPPPYILLKSKPEGTAPDLIDLNSPGALP